MRIVRMQTDAMRQVRREVEKNHQKVTQFIDQQITDTESQLRNLGE